MTQRVCENSSERFWHSTRNAKFELKLGAREIEMLGNGNYMQTWHLGDRSVLVGTVGSLIRKGLLDWEHGEIPTLSSAGELAVKMLNESGHLPVRSEPLRETLMAYEEDVVGIGVL